MMWPPGHFYSPIPSLDDIRRYGEFAQVPRTLRGIDLNEDGQLELVDALQQYYDEQPFSPTKTDGRRYYYENGFFSYGDGLMLYCMLRYLRPRKFIEIGSGFSSALVLDVNDIFLDGALTCSFIDPNPERLLSNLHVSDRRDLHALPVQQIDRKLFSALGPGDILFIDSSHVSKVGSDVNHLVFEVIPFLASGVFVHFHDIFFPFEYPIEWLHEGRAWNEAYVLRSFLMFNDSYRIRLFNSFLAHFHWDRMASALPLWAKAGGGSLWLERV